jgi:hypothetical protein
MFSFVYFMHLDIAQPLSVHSMPLNSAPSPEHCDTIDRDLKQHPCPASLIFLTGKVVLWFGPSGTLQKPAQALPQHIYIDFDPLFIHRDSAHLSFYYHNQLLLLQLYRAMTSSILSTSFLCDALISLW